MGHERIEINWELAALSVLGVLVATEGAVVLSAAMPPKAQHIIDCGNERQGSTSLVLQKNDSISMSAIDGNENISFKDNPDGSLTIYFNKGDKIIDLHGAAATVSQIDLKAGEKLAFEDNGTQIEIAETPTQNGGMNVQVSGTCKK